MKNIKLYFYKTMTFILIPISIIGFSFIGSYGFIKAYFRITNGISFILLVATFSLLLAYGKYLSISEMKSNKESDDENDFTIIE